MTRTRGSRQFRRVPPTGRAIYGRLERLASAHDSPRPPSVWSGAVCSLGSAEGRALLTHTCTTKTPSHTHTHTHTHTYTSLAHLLQMRRFCAYPLLGPRRKWQSLGRKALSASDRFQANHGTYVCGSNTQSPCCDTDSGLLKRTRINIHFRPQHLH